MKIPPSVLPCVLVCVATMVALGLEPVELVADPIVWSGGDGNWDEASNWSPQQVPGENDDAVIPAGPTVLLNNGGYEQHKPTSVRGLQSDGNLTIEPLHSSSWPYTYRTSLKVGAGGGEIRGLLAMRPETVLWSEGGTLTVSGPTDLEGANLWASGGGTLDMASLTTYTPDSSDFYAWGAGTFLDLSNLATIAPPTSSYWQLDIWGEDGAHVKTGPLAMDAATAECGELGFYAYGPGTLVDITAMPRIPEGMTWGALMAASGGTIKIADTFTNLDSQMLLIEGDGRIVGANGNDALPHFTSLTNGYLSVTQRNLPGEPALGSPNLAGLTDVSGTQIDVFDYGELALPAVTQITVGDDDEGLYCMAGNGSRLDLSSVTQIQASGVWNSYLQAYGGGYLDFSGVTEIPAEGFFDVNAWQDGTVIDFSSLTKINSSAWIVVEPGATVILGEAVEFTADDTTIKVYEGGTLITGGIVVSEGNSLKGSGTIDSSLLNSGTVAPGQSPGMLTVGDYVQTAAGKLQIEIDGTAPGEYDVLQVNGHAQLDGLLEVLVSPLLEIAPEMEFWILRSDSLSGTFAGLEEGAVAWSKPGGDDRLFVSYRNNGVFLVASLAEVPEPASVVLCGLGALALAGAAVRRVRSTGPRPIRT